jgi:hypothetical protein
MIAAVQSDKSRYWNKPTPSLAATGDIESTATSRFQVNLNCST